jgi:phosphoenolpyruvate-protein kinase (PTS system EI component)
MGSRRLAGAPASPGTALGRARLIDAPPENGERIQPQHQPEELRRATGALDAAAAELRALAEKLRDDGHEADAELIDTGVVLGEDPELRAAVERAIVEDGLAAPAAITRAAAEGAAAIASVEDPMLAARSDDVLSLGRRAARIATGVEAEPVREDGDLILVATGLGPADVSELGPEVKGIALAAGGVTAHAAIVARSLGIPMVVGLGDELLELAQGELLVVDGSRGLVLGNPEPEAVENAHAATHARALARERALSASQLPAITTDGRRVTVLVNAAGAQEVAAGFEAGAEGVGLLRTELAFLEASRWPSEVQHRGVLNPVLSAARGRPVTVRVLDYGGDKTPPFLVRDDRRGIALLAAHPEALEAQLRAILAAREDADLRVLVPMVRRPEDVGLVRERLSGALPVGAMIETREAVAAAGAIAAEADFLSIGTNDLACDVLGVERFSASRGLAHHPKVLDFIGQVAWAADGAGVPLEVCGEAASDPVTVPVLVGLGVDELSVGAARVGVVRSWIRALGHADARKAARKALEAASVADVLAAVGSLSRQLELLEVGDAAGQPLQRPVGVGTLGSQA